MTSGERPGLPARARLLLPIFLVILVAASVHRLSRPEPRPPAPTPPADDVPGFPSLTPTLQELGGETMGTRYVVRLALSQALAPDEQQGLEQAIAGVLERAEAAFSTYREDSEVNRLARHRSPSAFRMSEELAPVMRAAHEVSRQSQGAFDVTVRPLVEALGLGASGPRRGELDVRQRAELLSKVGYQKLHVGDHVLTKRHADLAIDLSGIALGYVVDRLSENLTQLGYGAHHVAIGGQQTGLGERAPGVPWEAVLGAHKVPLAALSVATTRLSDEGGVAGGASSAAVIDPRTGQRARHGLAAVSVAHPRGMVADAWATALAVLGPTDGLRMAREQHLAALFEVRDEAERSTWVGTAEFEQVERGEYIFDAANPAPDVGVVPARGPGDVAGGDDHGP